jgi:hypothetical protein
VNILYDANIYHTIMHYRKRQTKSKSKSRRSRNKKGGFDFFGLLPSAPVPPVLPAPAGQTPAPVATPQEEEKKGFWSSIFGSKETPAKPAALQPAALQPPALQPPALQPQPATTVAEPTVAAAGGRRKKTKTKTKKYKK